MSKVQTKISSHLWQLLLEIGIQSLRSSLLISGAILLISSTSIWQFVSSSFAAHDVKRAAAWADEKTQSEVVVVAIDDVGFENYFAGRSPLDRTKLIDVLRTVHEGAKSAQSLVIDLDLSPAAGEDPQKLVSFFGNHTPARWIVADPVLTFPDPNPQRVNWRQALCQAKVRLAFPYLPSEFGYTSSTHQYVGALADASDRPELDCAARQRLIDGLARTDEVIRLQRTPWPTSPSFVRDGLVVPFQGDLAFLRETLESINPKVVVIGGAWGRGDVFSTPFGERYGAQLHAAAIDGQRHHETLAPVWQRSFVAWVLAASLTVLFALLSARLVRLTAPWLADHPGHRFLMRRIWPLSMLSITFMGLLVASEAIAWLHAQTGYWIPSANVATVILANILFYWNWGLKEFAVHQNTKHAWRNTFIAPILLDVAGIQSALKQLIGQTAVGLPSVSASSNGMTMGRMRALSEALLATASLCEQLFLPLLLLIVLYNKPL